MKASLLALALALFGTTATAQTTIDLDVLAAESGLSQRQVGMVFGAHSAYTEYRASYAQVKRRFIESVGQQRYEALLAAYKAQQDGRKVAASVARELKSGS